MLIDNLMWHIAFLKRFRKINEVLGYCQKPKSGISKIAQQIRQFLKNSEKNFLNLVRKFFKNF